MIDVPTTEPREVRAGMTWKWKRNDLSADYPASTWTLTYWWKKTGASGANFSIVATADGADFAVTVTAATTAGYTAGSYTWSAVVTAGTEAYEVDHGTCELLARYDSAANLDDRSHAKTVLDAIEAVIEGRASKDQEEYSIGGRSLKRTPIKDLIALRTHYRAEVQAESIAERGGGGKLLVKL